MGFLWRAVVIIVGVVALGYMVWARIPRTTVTTHNVPKYRAVPGVSNVERTIQIDGKSVTVKIPVMKTEWVSETSVRTSVQHPTPRQRAEGWFYGVVLVFIGGYAAVILCLFGYDKFTRRADSADRRDNEKRLDVLVASLIGIVIGFFGVGVQPEAPGPVIQRPADEYNIGQPEPLLSTPTGSTKVNET